MGVGCSCTASSPAGRRSARARSTATSSSASTPGRSPRPRRSSGGSAAHGSVNRFEWESSVAATALKSRWSSGNARRAPPADTAGRDSAAAPAMVARLRVALAPDELRAVATAIERGTAIEIAARVIDLGGAASTGIEAGETIVLEMQTEAPQAGGLRSGAPDDETAIEPLTAREREVLELVRSEEHTSELQS